MNNYPKEVLEIHHAFHTAGDELIARAKEILKDRESFDVLKAKRLNEVGLINAQGAKVREDLSALKEGEIGIIEAEKLHYYNLRYPNNKYITINQVKAICEKYNLLYSDICRYKGFVPDKNLDEIAKFKVEPDDISTETATQHQINYHNKDLLEFYLDGGAYIEQAKLNQLFIRNYLSPIEVKSGFKICAPESDFIKEQIGAQIHGQFFILPELIPETMFEKKRKIIVVPDPVVLQPVNYGFLIVTAWGDEASDDFVVNPKSN